MNVKTIGIDLAKEVFQVCGMNAHGKVLLQKKVARRDLLRILSQINPAIVGMEACGSSNYWCREISKLGHEVKMIPAQFVKPYLKAQKNDSNDAEAICEAVSRANMRFVAPKSVEQQDLQSCHRIRERLIRSQTALSNEIRALLSEHGIIIPRGLAKLRERLAEIVSAPENGLTMFFKSMLSELYTELCDLEVRIASFSKKIDWIFRNDSTCRRLSEVPGVGPIVATAMICSVANPKLFKNGRQLSAWLGLVPRQNSSGGKTVLLGISKRGNCYLRKQLIHGARSVVYRVGQKNDSQSQWIRQKIETRGKNRTAVALANKNARIIWKMLTTGENYRKAA